MTIREHLIQLFTMDEPFYVLSFHHRTNLGKEALKKYKPVLDELIKEGNVKLVKKTTKETIYQYIATVTKP